MIRRKGISGFVGNSIKWIKGVFSPSYSITSINIEPPNRSHGEASIITSSGLSVVGKISLTGQSYLSTINDTFGLSCIIQSAGKSVNSNITNTGQGVFSK